MEDLIGSPDTRGDDGRSPVLTGPKRQHYLPRFYLEGFTRDGLLAVYDRETNDLRRQKPENTAVIGHLYTVEDEQGRKRFEVEQMLSEVESDASPVIGKLVNGETITADERAHLAAFLGFCVTRTPDLIDSLKLATSNMAAKLAKGSFADPGQVASWLRGRPDAPSTEEALQVEAEELVKFAQSDNYKVTTNHKFALSLAVGLVSEIAPIMAGRDWLVLHRKSERQSFITSDAPLVLTTVVPRPATFWGIGFANADALVIFPLSQSATLLIFGSNGGFVHAQARDEQIRSVNLSVAAHCQRYVLGRDEALVSAVAKRLNLYGTKWQPKFSAR